MLDKHDLAGGNVSPRIWVETLFRRGSFTQTEKYLVMFSLALVGKSVNAWYLVHPWRILWTNSRENMRCDMMRFYFALPTKYHQFCNGRSHVVEGRIIKVDVEGFVAMLSGRIISATKKSIVEHTEEGIRKI